jgi:tetratricopeptide (TPR) repeat protein
VTRAALVAALVFAGAALARADTVWDRAIADGETEAAMDTYRRQLEAGNEEVTLAASEPPGRSKYNRVRRAITAYRNAVTAAPDEPEAHYRLGITAYTYLLVCDIGATVLCDPDHPDPAVMQDVADHWHRFTELAPLDIRGTGLLFARAILHTKLTTRENLELAIVDYESILERIEGFERGTDLSAVVSNLAETYMMVGRLDEAIAAYERSAGMGGDISSMYGLAVALDRDGQGTRARQIISGLKLAAFETFQTNVSSGKTFFVPPGEVNYYLALAEESLGMPQQALVHWERFLQSKAHPQFAPRAKHNRDVLRTRLQRGPK